MRGTVERPAGLVYRPALLDDAEQRELTAVVAGYAYEPVVMHGQAARRRVRHFGARYGYDSHGLTEADPLPAPLLALRDRCAALAGTPPAAFVEALVTHYPAGATIGWHRDAPTFGSVIAGVSLGSPCLLRFQRRVGSAAGAERRVHELELAPGSAYLLTGAARWSWQHSIPAVPAPRWSVTFRTLRSRGRSAAAGRRPEPVADGLEPLGEADGGEVAVAAADDLHADR